MCLPVPYTEEVAKLYPWWARRLDVGNVLVHELLFLFWLFCYGAKRVLSGLLFGTPTRIAAVLLIALALWCGMISLLAPLPWLDIGRTLRLLVNAALMIAVATWGRQFGTLPLAAIVIGFLQGTVINLMMSFQYPLLIDGVMRLAGQNTPGVTMGVAIHLAAWWFYLSDRSRTKLLIILATFVFAFACAISFSRIGWFAGATGLLAWGAILCLAPYRSAAQQQQLRRVRRVLAPMLLALLAVIPITKTGQVSINWLSNLVAQKASYEGEGDQQRLTYLYGVIEIIAQHPLGVGYSGFYGAMANTAAYRSPKAAVEESPADANPHSTFLWYAAAGGIPGLILSLAVFICLLGQIHYGLRAIFGGSGLILFGLIAATYWVMGLSVPYLLSNIILIFPAAFLVGLGQLRRKAPMPLGSTIQPQKTVA